MNSRLSFIASFAQIIDGSIRFKGCDERIPCRNIQDKKFGDTEQNFISLNLLKYLSSYSRYCKERFLQQEERLCVLTGGSGVEHQINVMKERYCDLK